jgi:hypothetical protein
MRLENQELKKKFKPLISFCKVPQEVSAIALLNDN